MKKAYLFVEIEVDDRFTLSEVKYHLQRALDNYINNLDPYDDMDIVLGEVTLSNVDPRQVSSRDTRR
jgi:hypothetical protein